MLALLMLAMLVGMHDTAAQSSENQPVKLRLLSNRQVYKQGQTAVLEIVLYDANNQRRRILEDIQFDLKVNPPNAKSYREKIRIKQNFSAVGKKITLEEPGLYEISTSSDQLLNDGLLLKVKDMVTREIKSGIDLDLKMRKNLRLKVEEPAATLVNDNTFEVQLRVFPDEPRLADGNDNAKIYAYLMGRQAVAPADIQIILHNNDGHLDPNVLKIKKGNFRGQSNLTSEHVGPVTVEYIDARPGAKVKGPKKLVVDFRPPVTRLQLTSSPQDITILEKTDIIARFLDHKGNLIADDRTRKVHFTLKQGHGHFSSSQVEIPANQGYAKTEFFPTRAEVVTIEAHTQNLLKQKTQINVGWPFMLLALTAVGAAIGGLLSFLLKKGTRWWVILAGPVFGIVLYWAAIFGLITTLPNHIILNPISAFTIAVIGGWAGPRVLDTMVKRFEGPV